MLDGWARRLAAVALAVSADATSVLADDLVRPDVDSSSFVSSISRTASYFGINEVRGGPALSNLELYLGMQPDLTSLDKGRLDSFQWDVFFDTPDPDLLKWIGSPRPELGGVVNLAGYEDLVHLGLNWHLPVFSTPFYLEGGVGAGLQNGYLANAPAGYHNTGCPLLFHYEYGVGTNLSPNVTATLEWQHLSSMDLCQPNKGLNHLGVAIGWKF